MNVYTEGTFPVVSYEGKYMPEMSLGDMAEMCATFNLNLHLHLMSKDGNVFCYARVVHAEEDGD